MKLNASCLILFFSALLIQSCSTDETTAQSRFPNVDQALWPYYSAFEEAAIERGFDYDLNQLKISGEIKEIHQDGVAGSCRFGSHINNEVTIDLGFWNNSSSLYKEFVVFHELGHCVLLRDHDESIDNQGRCLSIMRSGLTNCRDAYSLQNRDYYLDELFYQD